MRFYEKASIRKHSAMKINVLDHGYVKFIEAYGRGAPRTGDAPVTVDFEVGIIEAARQSTQGNFRGWKLDSKLLAYLYNNKHFTPFEFSGMVIEVQAPIFVFREWHRHRTQSYNEMSARYEPLPDLYYLPKFDDLWTRICAVTSNKQAASIAISGTLTQAHVHAWLAALESQYIEAEQTYQAGLNAGIPKELARLIMPVGHYTRMRASANLRNWLAFLTLRMDEKAQWEIRQFANAVGECIACMFPQVWELFNQEKKP